MSEENTTLISIIIGGFLLAGLMTFFVVGMIILHRQRQVQNKQKLDQIKVEYEKTLLNIENEIQHETLNHIGRELHDNIGQLLSLAKLNLNSSRPEKQEEAKNILNSIIKEVRALSKTLNIDWVGSTDLKEFIAHQLSRIEDTGFCSTELQVRTEIGIIPKEQKLVLIRVIQEILNNAIKHASPNRIEVKIQIQSSRKTIFIRDDGKGFDTKNTSQGSGMTNLDKRMQTIGGSFALSSAPGRGTEITLSLPN